MATDPNLAHLEAAAEALGPLLDDLCLVGGCAAGLLITDPGADPVRPTLDVDLIVEVTGYIPYRGFCEKLIERGFEQPIGNDVPLCRFTRDPVCVDIMPLDEQVLGFGNPWYRSAFTSRATYRLPRGATLHHIDAPHFLATKLAAYEGRGNNRPVESQDLEDLIRVVDGRPDLAEEMAASSLKLRRYVARVLSAVTRNEHFNEALPTYFEDGTERAPIVFQRIEALCGAG
ncbi:MAG TPA: hypothetical protein ENJ09_00295 [Planctomycetes bacterium]|nr:hypothetical protein [Planctomycetota bacterium]